MHCRRWRSRDEREATPVSPTHEPAALWPLLVCQRHRLPSQLERSFRLELGAGLLCQRYILGCPARAIAAEQLLPLVRDLGMPISAEQVQATLLPHLQRASTVYLGYEQAASGDSHRLYFEYWDEVVQRLSALPAVEIEGWCAGHRPRWEMGVGYKWPIGHASQGAAELYTTAYQVQPMLPKSEMLMQAEAVLGIAGVPADLRLLVQALLQAIVQHSPGIDPVFLEVAEADSPRRSFDLSVHRLELSLQDLEPWLNPLICRFLGHSHGLRDCLHGAAPQACLTHISAGCSRRGFPFCCVYYDPSP